MRTLTLIEDRPAQAPAGWEVYNAPRPLAGHTHWQGEFRHGIFYTAINPEDGRYSEVLRQRTADLDGYRVEYITEKDARARCLAYYLEKYTGRTFGNTPEERAQKIESMVADAGTHQLARTLAAINEAAEKAAEKEQGTP